MIITTSVILPGQGRVPGYLEILRRKMQRVRWFDYVRRHFDMVALADVADWCARERGGLDRSEERRSEAYQELLTAILQGEFGSGEWPALAHMPRDVPTYSPYCLRLSRGQIAYLSAHDPCFAAALWAPRRLVARWFQSRGMELPPWLMDLKDEPQETAPDPSLRTEAPTQVADNEASPIPTAVELSKPPFDANQAHGILAGMKHGGHIAHRPSREEAQELLKSRFDHVPRDPIEASVKKLWGPGKRGHRKSRTAKSAK
jgi:hypothetical protein